MGIEKVFQKIAQTVAQKNRVRRVNKQIDVWRRNAPTFISNFENKMEMRQMDFVNKSGQQVFTTGKLTPAEQKEQQRLLDYYEKNFGKYSEKIDEVRKEVSEKYDIPESEISREDIDDILELTGEYEQLQTEIWNEIEDTNEAEYVIFQAEMIKGSQGLRETVDFLKQILENGSGASEQTLNQFRESKAESNPFESGQRKNRYRYV